MRGAERGDKRSVGDAIAELIAALAMSISGIGMAIAVAALIFAGPLEAGLPRATTNYILATAIVTGLIGWRSRLIPAVAVIQDGPAVVLIAVAAAVAKRSSDSATADSTTADSAPLDVLVLIVCITAVTALAMTVIGYFDLAGIVRFLPTTVIGGFIAGTGWLLVKGGFDVMVGSSLGRDDIAGLFEPQVLQFWLPGLALGVGMQVLGSRPGVSPIAISALVPAAGVTFFGVVVASSSISVVEDANWLIGPFPPGSGVQLITPSELQLVNWSNIIASPGSVLAVVVVSLMALLLNLSGLEVLTGSRLDMRGELRTTGLTNLLIAPLGAPPGFHALGDTALARQMGARTRFVPLATAAVCVLTAMVGSGLLGYTPRFIAGGLLVAVGIGLLLNWGSSMLGTPSRVERLLSTVILVLIATVGILEGITVGLVVACLIFVLRYSRVDPIRLEARGYETPSRVTRTAAHRQLLSANDSVVIFQLTGYLFFGSFTTVANRVRLLLEESDAAVDFLVLDFRHVTGIDTSAFALLDQLAGATADADTSLLISGLAPSLRSAVEGPNRTLFEELDDALEFAEERVLERELGQVSVDHADPFGGLSSELRAEFTKRTIKAGEILIRQGEPGKTIFLLIAGSLIVTRIDPDGSRHRLRRISCGALVGELSVLTDGERSAEITADTCAELLEFAKADYERLRREQPTLALEFQDLVLRELVARSASLSQYLSMALR